MHEQISMKFGSIVVYPRHVDALHALSAFYTLSYSIYQRYYLPYGDSVLHVQVFIESSEALSNKKPTRTRIT